MGAVLVMVGFALATVAVVVLVEKLSDWLRLPAAVLLTVAGLVYALLPGPNVVLKPDFVLDVLLPPLLYNAALGSSLLAIRSRLRTVVSLSVLLVLATALLVGGLVAWLVPVVPLAAAVALGAAVAPPDPVAALSIGRRAGLPAKLSTLIEGEGLLNDATALTTLSVAIAVARGGVFSFGGAAGQFLLAAVGGLAIGVVVALVVRLARRFLNDPLSSNAVSLAVPFGAYAAAEGIHVSGVLAVVVAGLIIGHQNPRLQTGANRLQTAAVWQLVNYLLEGFAFLLIGQQLPEVIRGLHVYSVATIVTISVVTVGVVLVLRPLWLIVTQALPGWLHTRLGGDTDTETEQTADRKALSGKEITAMSWAGTRGVITLAAAFTIPLTVTSGAPFPARDLLLFAAYLLVLVTLLGQGLTFGPLLRALGLRADPRDLARVRNQARAAAAGAALARLDQLTEDDEEIPEKAVANIRRSLTTRQHRYQARVASLEDESAPLRPAGHEAASTARRAVLEAQHEELLRWRDAGRLPDTSLRHLQRELDHEEGTLPFRGPGH